jgi:hypothetical protein
MDGIRTEYPSKLIMNGRTFGRILIDQHYRRKHSESMRDHLILELVESISGRYFPVVTHRNGFDFFVIEPVIRNGMPYRLVLVTSRSDDFVGVVNAFRVNRRKK